MKAPLDSSIAADSAAERQRRLAAARQWGDFTQAYSTAVQQGLERFWHGDGYLAFQTKWRIACVLGDPVAPPALVEPLLRAFLAKHRRACFWQISRTTAETLQRLGLWINEMGVDTRIELSDYDFTGKLKERFRHATNWFEKHRYFVCEGMFLRVGGNLSREGEAAAEPRRASDAIPKGSAGASRSQERVTSDSATIAVDAAEIAQLSAAWQQSRKIRTTVRFFNRPIVLADEPDVRKFFLVAPTGQVEAFVFFDPLYRAGAVVGYSPAIKRRAPAAPLRAEEGIMRYAIEQFQREGRQRVMLGLSPLAGIEDREFRYNPLVRLTWSRGMNAWWINRYFYNLRGHADFKRRFGGVEEKTYYASDALFNDPRVIATLRLAGVL